MDKWDNWEMNPDQEIPDQDPDPEIPDQEIPDQEIRAARNEARVEGIGLTPCQQATPPMCAGVGLVEPDANTPPWCPEWLRG